MSSTSQRIQLQPTPVATGCADCDGRLIYVDGMLLAILVRLEDEIHGSEVGRWHLECGLGKLLRLYPRPFRTLQEAEAWILSVMIEDGASATATGLPRGKAVTRSADHAA